VKFGGVQHPPLFGQLPCVGKKNEKRPIFSDMKKNDDD
jgi:hypothetical protein